MATIQYHELKNGNGDYAKYRFQVMSDVWGAETRPYLADNSDPMIGTHLDLIADTAFGDFRTIVAEIVKNPTRVLIDDLWNAATSTTYASDAELRQALDQVLSDDGVGGKFAFASLKKMQAALDGISTTQNAESELSSSSDGDIPYSKERAVVFSLAFEGQDVNDVLQAMLVDGDRFEAWYDIRYASNDDSDDDAQQRQDKAERRYTQSDLFGLYNDAKHVGFGEARGVALDYQSHRDAIQAYEQFYDPDGGNGNASEKAHGKGSGDDIADELQPAIKALLHHFGATGGHLEEVLYVVAGVTDLHGDGTSYDGRRNDDDLLISDSASNVLWGDQGNDVLIGNAGSDTLNGGIGNDRLYGGSDNDALNGDSGNDWLFGGPGHNTLDGGAGNDTLVGGNDGDSMFGGGGKDKITGGSGNDTIHGGGGADILTGGAGADTYYADASDKIVEQGNGGNDTLIAGSSGKFNVKNVEKFQLSGEIGGNVSVELNQFGSFDLTDGADKITIIVNHLQKNAIDIHTGGGADTVKIELAPGVDPSQVLDHKGVTARFDFVDLTASDTIDLTDIGIKQIVQKNVTVHDDHGYYLMAPDTKIDVVENGHKVTVYTNDTHSWFVTKLGDETPYGPEFFGHHLTAGNFDI